MSKTTNFLYGLRPLCCNVTKGVQASPQTYVQPLAEDYDAAAGENKELFPAAISVISRTVPICSAPETFSLAFPSFQKHLLGV